MISAAEQAFYSGLHLALLILVVPAASGEAVLVWVTFRSAWTPTPPRRFHLSRATALRATGAHRRARGRRCGPRAGVETTPKARTRHLRVLGDDHHHTSTQKTGGDTTEHNGEQAVDHGDSTTAYRLPRVSMM
ncbi:MAG: hypothetical protein R2716_00380 [Microthrixaceae bacterium]